MGCKAYEDIKQEKDLEIILQDIFISNNKLQQKVKMRHKMSQDMIDK